MDLPKAWIEAGGKAIYDAEPNYEDDPVTPWENAGASTQNRYREKATACLAAVFGKATLVRTNEFDDCNLTYAEVDCDWDVREGSEVELEPRATLVIVRGW